MRKIGTNGPVLKKVGPVMKKLAELAAVDNLYGERDGGHTAVILANRVGHSGSLYGFDHR